MGLKAILEAMSMRSNWARVVAAVLILPFLVSCGEEVDPLDRIQRENTILVSSVPFAGPYFYQKQTEMVGPEAELAQRITAKLGSDIRLVYAPRTFATVVPALAKGETQIALGGVGVSDERKQDIDFSNSYHSFEISLIINPAHKIIEPNELNGLKLAVREGTVIQAFAASRCPDCTIVPVSTLDSAVLSLRRKEVDAILDDRIMAAYSLDTVTGAGRLELHPEVITSIPIAIGVPTGASNLLGAVNEVVAEAQRENAYETWLQEHAGDRLDKVVARYTDRKEREERAVMPRAVSIRVSKDADSPFDIYRLANLRFKLTAVKNKKTTQSSKIDFRGPVGRARVTLPPGAHQISLTKYGTLGTVSIRPTDADAVNINIRFKKSGEIRIQ